MKILDIYVCSEHIICCLGCLYLSRCSPSGIRDIHLLYFRHFLLWLSVETQGREGRESVWVGECSSFALSQNKLPLSVQILWQAHGRELFTRFRVMFYTGQQKDLVYSRNWNCFMFDHLQPQAIFFSSCVHYCQRNMGLIP